MQDLDCLSHLSYNPMQQVTSAKYLGITQPFMVWGYYQNYKQGMSTICKPVTTLISDLAIATWACLIYLVTTLIYLAITSLPGLKWFNIDVALPIGSYAFL